MGSGVNRHLRRHRQGMVATVSFLLLILGVTPLVFGGQGATAFQRYRHQSWSKAEGLPHLQVNAVLRARDGFLWVGTRAGLVRFDGVRFSVFLSRNEPGLRSEDIRCLAEDAAGVLWVGTAEGLARYNGGFEWIQQGSLSSEIQFESTDPPLNRVMVLHPDRRGGLWIGTYNGLYHHLDGRLRLVRYDGDASLRITAIAEGPDGTIWLGQSGALFRGDPQGDDDHYELKLVAQADDVGQSYFHDLAIDSAGRLRLMAGLGAALVAEALSWENGRWQSTPELRAANGVRPLFLKPDGQGGFWIPEAGVGLALVRNGQRVSHRLWPAEAVDHVLCFHQDAEGNVWAGSESAGLHLLQPTRIETWNAADGLAQDIAWAIVEDRTGTMWIGTENGLSSLRDGRFESYTVEQGLVSPVVRALAEDAAGRLWIGTGSGLEVREGTNSFRIRFAGEWFHTKIRTVHHARDGSTWVGAAKGLHHIHDGVTNSWYTTDGLANDDVRVIHEDRHGVFWFGTAGGGLHRFEGGRITIYGPERGVPGTSVWAIHEDDNGVLWLGGDRGLSRFVEERGFRFGVEQGLPDNLVNTILEDAQNRFWIGHDRGIYRVNRAGLEEVAAGRARRVNCVEYNEADGLPSAETNGQNSHPAAVRTRDGRLWFSTPKGVAVIDPASLPDPTNAPLPILETVRLGAQQLYPAVPSPATSPADSRWTSSAPAIVIPPGAGQQLEFTFTAPTFRRPDQLRFRHRLLGFDRGWLEDGTTRRVLYGVLPPGRYALELQALTQHGISSGVVSAISIRVLPQWFQTGWFFALATLAVGGTAALAYRARVLRLRRIHQARAEEALVRERTRIARDLHDGLGANLTALTWLAAQTDQRNTAPPPDPQKLQALSQSSRAALHELQDIIWSASPENDTLESLANRLADQAARLCELAGIRCRLDLPAVFPDIRLPAARRKQLLMMVREALHNALRHARAKEVRLHISVADSELCVVVQDNGRGFVVPSVETDSAAASRPGPSGQGLRQLHERAREIGARLTLNSQEGSGTAVTIRLPIDAPGGKPTGTPECARPRALQRPAHPTPNPNPD